jgi:hypothetical protein
VASFSRSLATTASGAFRAKSLASKFSKRVICDSASASSFVQAGALLFQIYHASQRQVDFHRTDDQRSSAFGLPFKDALI